MHTAVYGSKAAAALLVATVLSLAVPAAAQDWPSWRGRGQTGVSETTGLVSSWSPDGENLIRDKDVRVTRDGQAIAEPQAHPR